jgi:hypothetical protein
MKRWLAICAASVGVFVLGAVTGVLLEDRAKAQMYRTMCLSLFADHGSEALLTMNLLAEGHADSAYDLAEGDALLCASPVKPEHRSPEMLDCAKGLRAFYDHYPECKASLERRHPAEAKSLGFGATP